MFVRSPFIHSPFSEPNPRSVAVSGLTMAGSVSFDGINDFLSIASFSSTSPDRRTFTVSAWVRTTDAGPGNQEFIAFFLNATNAGAVFLFGNDDSINIRSTEGTAQLLEYDTGEYVASSWAHFVAAVDTTQATAANRCRIYRDNVELTTAVEDTTPAQNTDLRFFVSGDQFRVGGDGDANTFIGNLADVIVVEGQQLTPSSFGFDNGGTWSWQDYTGSFGSHGYRMNPQTASEIGTDQSGNGNTMTLNSMDTGNFTASQLPPT